MKRILEEKLGIQLHVTTAKLDIFGRVEAFMPSLPPPPT
jgi:hypothetical protein